MKIQMKPLFDRTFRQDVVLPPPPELDDISSGELMFTEDQIYETPYMLDQLLREVLVKQGVTRDLFVHRFKNYATRELGLHSTTLNSTRGNTLKAMYRGNVSPLIFRRVLLALGYEVRNMTVELTTDRGQHLTFALNKMVDRCKDITTVEDDA